MPIVVQKYGGSSVADVERIGQVADRVAATRAAGKDVVVVVSAMGDTTDELLALAAQVTRQPARRELDMLLSAGERISMALLSMAINARGVPAVSFTGSQSGIITNDAHTDARIVEVRPFRVQDELARGRVVIVAGYQGVSYKREVTTLGRGGSDTTAVALAAALDAEACEIYSDVDGVYSADPRVVPDGAPPRRALLRGDAGAGRVGGAGAERPGRRVRQGARHRHLRPRDLGRRQARRSCAASRPARRARSSASPARRASSCSGWPAETSRRSWSRCWAARRAPGGRESSSVSTVPSSRRSSSRWRTSTTSRRCASAQAQRPRRLASRGSGRRLAPSGRASTRASATCATRCGACARAPATSSASPTSGFRISLLLEEGEVPGAVRQLHGMVEGG